MNLTNGRLAFHETLSFEKKITQICSTTYAEISYFISINFYALCLQFSPHRLLASAKLSCTVKQKIVSH